MTSLARIIAAVADDYGLPAAVLLSATRRQPMARARQVAMFLAREMTVKSLHQIALGLCRIDHTTVAHGIEATVRRIAADPGFGDRVGRIRAMVVG